MLYSMEGEFVFLSKASLFDCGLVNWSCMSRSRWHVGLHASVSLVGLLTHDVAHLKNNIAWLQQRLVSLSF